MARFPLALIGPASSTGSPITFMMRPRVPSPTGTAIACPVSNTSFPRTRPSVESIAMVRTVDSPRCCATSRISRFPLLSVSSAFRISGSAPSNCTSTTAPMTCAMRPILLLAGLSGAFIAGLSSPSNRLGAGDDFDQLLGNHCLAGPVILQGQSVDHIARIAGCRIHRAHARALFGGGIFQQGAENLYRDIARQQIGKNFRLIRLVIIHCAPGRRFSSHRGFDRCGNQPLRGWLLRHHGPEPRIHDRRHIEFAAVIHAENLAANFSGIAESNSLYAGEFHGLDNVPAVKAPELIAAFAPQTENLDLFAFAQQLI